MFKKKKPLDLDETKEEISLEELSMDESEIEELKIEAEKMEEEDIQKHEEHYSNDGLWNKIKKFSKKAGSSVVYVVLILYYTLQKPELPLRVKAIIAGVFGKQKMHETAAKNVTTCQHYC